MPGLEVERRDGKTLTVIDFKYLNKVETTYNLEVSDWHTYYVGDAGLLVHNCPWGQDRGNTGKKGNEKRPGSKKDRDSWYGNKDTDFQKWWERSGKDEFNDGRDIEDAQNMRDAYEYWKEIGLPGSRRSR